MGDTYGSTVKATSFISRPFLSTVMSKEPQACTIKHEPRTSRMVFSNAERLSVTGMSIGSTSSENGPFGDIFTFVCSDISVVSVDMAEAKT